MSNLDDIFDLPEGAKQYIEEQAQASQPVEKKPRKKPELSEEKKAAMLERLRLGREKRQDNLKAKKEPKEEPKEVVIKKEKEVVKKTDTEAERLSFINMMAGKAKPNQSEKFERPKKKVQSTPIEEVKEEKKKEEPKEPKSDPIISAPVISVAAARQPVVIRTFKKPIWA